MNRIVANAAKIAIFAAVMAVAIIVAMPFFRHAAGLLTHFASGSWEIGPEQSTNERRLRSLYASSAGWAIHMPTGSGSSFSMAQPDRAESINQLGSSSVADHELLRFEPDRLFEYYGRLLDDLASYLRLHPEDAQHFGLVLSRAKLRFDHYAIRAADTSGFEVTTRPVYDQLDAWDLAAQRGEQTGRCRGMVESLAAQSEAIPAEARVFPRYLDPEIIRPWMSRDLLARAAGVRNERIQQYFRPGGGLHLIPRFLAVEMPSGVSLSGFSRADAARIVRWIADGACCRVICSDDTLALDSQTVEITDRVVVGELEGAPPRLMAIVSERRAFQNE